jgi:hypothetical protein
MPDKVAEAEAYWRESEAILQPRGPTKLLAGVLGIKGVARLFGGDLDGARALFEESLRMGEALGFSRWVALMQVNLAELAFMQSRPEDAISIARASIARCRATRLLRPMAAALCNLAGYLLAEGRTAEAHVAAHESLDLHVAFRMPYRATQCIEHLARVAMRQGDARLAARLAGYTDNYYRSHGQSRERVEAAGWADLQASLDQVLAASEREALMAEGAALPEDAAVTTALVV